MIIQNREFRILAIGEMRDAFVDGQLRGIATVTEIQFNAAE